MTTKTLVINEIDAEIQAATEGAWDVRDVRDVQLVGRVFQAESHLPAWRVYAWFPGDCEPMRSFDDKADAVAYARELADCIGVGLRLN